jgi:hypothetical protein
VRQWYGKAVPTSAQVVQVRSNTWYHCSAQETPLNMCLTILDSMDQGTQRPVAHFGLLLAAGSQRCPSAVKQTLNDGYNTLNTAGLCSHTQVV